MRTHPRARGVAAARTVAASSATGELLHVLDADDELPPGALAALVDALAEEPDAAWATGASWDVVDGDGTVLERRTSPLPPGLVKSGEVLSFRRLHGRCPFPPAQLAVRTSALWAAGGWPALAIEEDTALLLALDAHQPGRAGRRGLPAVAAARRAGHGRPARPDGVVRRRRPLAAGARPGLSGNTPRPTVAGASMRAVFQSSFGGPDVLEVGEQPEPLLGPDTITVRVRAAGVNPVDWKIREGYLQQAFPHALPLVPGWDVAGVVEAVGPAVRELAVGDEVLGYVRKDLVQGGTYAELVSASTRHLARKPAGVSFEAAAALPLAGLTALQSLDAVGVATATSCSSTPARAASATWPCSSPSCAGPACSPPRSERNHDFLRSLGAEPLAYGDGLVDAVRALVPDGVDAAVDYVGGESIEQSAAVAKDAARTASNVDPTAIAKVGGLYCFVRPDSDQLAELVGLVERGDLRVEVQQVLPLEQAAEAHRVLQDGHVRGKLVLTV